MTAIVTLTSDFGMRDPYVAAMKGVLLQLAPELRVVDLSHEIGAHDVMEGALFLASAVPFFPAGTVHVAVIDPGVGTERRALAARVVGQLIIGPDNGLLTFLLRRNPLEAAHAIESPRFMREHVSETFHGRDVFAPAAALLAGGVPLEDVGPLVDRPTLLDIPPVERREEDVCGRVIHIDRFGNAITNIGREHLPADLPLECRIGSHVVEVGRTYADAAGREAIALFGSSDLLEIAVDRESAARRLDLRRGDDVRVSALAGDATDRSSSA